MGISKFLIVVVGPTAVGKTSLSIRLANYYHTEVISADSRQFFRELSIGTAKPTIQELSQVRHHFIDSLSIMDDYDVGKYEQEAILLMGSLFEKHEALILTGGSGLYVKAVCEGLDELPVVDEEIRNRLNEDYAAHGLSPLQLKLKALDPVYYAQVDLQNPQRVIRALEVCLSTGIPFSQFRKGKKKERGFNVIKIGLEVERTVLYQRIDERMDQMIVDGLFEEAERFYDKKHLNALQTVGYQEIYGYLDGAYDKEEAIRLLKRNSRRYAKRQLTWFKRDAGVRWFHPADEREMVAYIEQCLSKGPETK